MRSSSSGLKVGIGVAVVILAVIAFVRMGRRTESPTAPDSPALRQPMKQSDRVQERLKKLQARSAPSRMDMPSRPAARAAGQLSAQRKMSATPAPGVAAAPPAEPQEEEEQEPIDADPDDIPALKKLLQDPDPERRLAAVTLLGSSDDPEVIPTLAQALSDQDEEVRMAALQALSDFTDEPPVEAIESALNDSSADIRFEALDVLSDIGGDRVRPAIERALNDPDEDVRSLAEGILDFEQLYEETPGDGEQQQVPQAPAKK